MPPVTFVAPALLVVAVLACVVPPVYARVTAIPEPVIQDPKDPSSNRVIFILKGYLLQEEFDVLTEWLWPLWDELPDVVSVQVCRSDSDRLIKNPSIHIFLLNGESGIIGTGTGASFEKATENLVRNLIYQGYLVSPRKKPLLSIELPPCKEDEANDSTAH